MTMDRAQAHTLEAIAAAMILVSSLVFALQVTAVTPLTGSTSSQHIENQQAAVAEGLLDAAAENGTLVPTLLYWNESRENWHGATRDGYVRSGPPTAFGSTLNETFLERGIAFDLSVYYVEADGDRLREPDGSVSETTLANASYVVDDADPEQELYSVVEVELVVWRM